MNYEKPIMELIRFASEDIVRTSNPIPPADGGWSGDNDETDFQ